MLNLRSGLLLLAVGSLAACNSGGISTSTLPDNWDVAIYDTNDDGILSIEEAIQAWSTLSIAEKKEVAQHFGLTVAMVDNAINNADVGTEDCTWQEYGQPYGGIETTTELHGEPTTEINGGNVKTVEVQEGDFIVTYTYTTEKTETTITPRQLQTIVTAVMQTEICK